MVDKVVDEIIKNGGFIFVQRVEPVIVNNRAGLLVWDYGIYNEITFVDSQTHQQQKMFSNLSDSSTNAEFERLVKITQKIVEEVKKDQQKVINREEEERVLKKLDEIYEKFQKGAITKEDYDFLRERYMARLRDIV